MRPPALKQELDVALRLAREAGALLLKGLPDPDAVERKADDSPVTVLDRQCEALIRGGVLDAFPRDGFLGEESGAVDAESGRTWIVDPLDGTRPFIRGIPTYGTLIALEADGEPLVGVMYFPALQTTCWAARGDGAWCDGEPISVSDCSRVEAAMGSALGHVECRDDARGARVLEFMRRWDYAYGFMDAYSYLCLCRGSLDLVVNLLDKPWDCAAAACIVEEAGGSFSDLDGGRSVHSGGILLSNGRLHDAMVKALNGG